MLAQLTALAAVYGLIALVFAISAAIVYHDFVVNAVRTWASVVKRDWRAARDR